MEQKKENKDAIQILHKRYITDEKRKASLEKERVNAEVARMIYELRVDAGLSQQELADLIETTQSVISRLEDDDYEGHSLSMLNKISKALNKRLTILMKTNDSEAGTLRYAFQVTLENMRRAGGLTVEQLAMKTGIDHDEILAMERNDGYRPQPYTLHILSKFYGIPDERLAALAGAFREIPEDIKRSAAKYAAQSESFAKLTKQEKKALDDFIKTLRKEK